MVHLCQEMEQQNVDHQGKQIGEDNDQDILDFDRGHIRVVEHDRGHEHKSQDGDDGEQPVAALHFPIALFDAVAEIEAVDEQEKEVQPDAQFPDYRVPRANAALCDKGDEAVDKSPQTEVAAQQERGFGGMRGGEHTQKHQDKDHDEK